METTSANVSATVATPDVTARPAWAGRIDGIGPAHRRWHSAVNADEATTPGAAVIGFRSDEGVRRNGGRQGAADGPGEIRRALASKALDAGIVVHDAGDVMVVGDDLEDGHDRLAAAVSSLVRAGHTPLVLGGGHETAYGSYQGLANSGALDGRRLGILNLDAHFDLREASRATSGTPFRQIAGLEADRGAPFTYAVVGISEPSNTAALFDAANALNVVYRTDEECQERHLSDVLAFVAHFVDSVDVLHLSIDLDVLPAASAPGVSAPASVGVPPTVIVEICKVVAASPKLTLVDVVELNPAYDIDYRTAGLAARLVHTLTVGSHRARSRATAPTGPDAVAAG
ncbi:formimidoylglutamase [Streptomyces sp. NBC_01525]|uniref:formimidoylglutamase n=1 Tax=Streptomyces sp. NBC_01525 TaxID=2903893 RepID=UPI0038663CA9